MPKVTFVIISGVMSALLVSGCAARRPEAPRVAPTTDRDGRWLQIGTEAGRIVPLTLDRYVEGTILAEVPLGALDGSTARRVAQLQAVLARTYAMANLERHAHEGFDLCTTTHCQRYQADDAPPDGLRRLVADAVQSTAGMVVTFEGRPINAVYHADCGGHTSDAEAVWRGSNPMYLRGLPDTFCRRQAPRPWQFVISEPALVQTLSSHTHTDVGTHLRQITVTDRDAAGRVLRVRLDGQHRAVVRGEQLRAAVVSRHGARSIKSTRFDIHRSGRQFIFEGRGFGHGVGLCQTGAIARARAGHSPQQILAHYYPGTRLGTLRPEGTGSRQAQ